jgi:spermidine/putrescine transport system permease protein
MPLPLALDYGPPDCYRARTDVRRRPGILPIVVFLLVAFLYLPLVVVALFAFNSRSNLSWPIRGIALRWFRLLFRDPSFSSAFRTSAEVATVVALVSAGIGVAAGLVFARRRTRLTRLLQGLSLIPAMMPPLFIAIALFTAMDYFKVQPGFGPIVVGHLLIVIPFVLVVITARLQRLDLDLEEAARDLGAGPAQTLRRVTLPIVFPAVAGAALLAFAFSFDEVLVTNFTSGTTTTLPVYVFSKLHRSIDPSINAVATLLMAVPWLALGVAVLLLRRSGPSIPTAIERGGE